MISPQAIHAFCHSGQARAVSAIRNPGFCVGYADALTAMVREPQLLLLASPQAIRESIKTYRERAQIS